MRPRSSAPRTTDRVLSAAARTLTVAAFAPAVGDISCSIARTASRSTLELVEARLIDPDAPAADPAARARRSASPSAGGPNPPCRSASSACEHDALGALDIFLVPVARDATGVTTRRSSPERRGRAQEQVDAVLAGRAEAEPLVEASAPVVALDVDGQRACRRVALGEQVAQQRTPPPRRRGAPGSERDVDDPDLVAPRATRAAPPARRRRGSRRRSSPRSARA